MTTTAAELRAWLTNLGAKSPVVFCLPDGRHLILKERQVIPDVIMVDGKQKFAGPPTLVICLEPEPPTEKVAAKHQKGPGF